MSFLNKFKKESPKEKALVKPQKEMEKKTENAEKPKAKPIQKISDTKIKGKTVHSYKFLIKPLITEKASSMGADGKYIFAVSPTANKIEIKKAIRTVYNIEPIKINILNYSGKSVHYGKTSGKTKNWKKAIVTLKPGEKIEIYEGV